MEKRSNRIRNSETKVASGRIVVVRRKACMGKKIENPLVREKLMAPISPQAHPQERLLGAILRSLPRDILKSFSFPFYREQLRNDMCHRVKLPALTPLKAQYSSIESFNESHAAMVLEEVRHTISEQLYRRWGKDRIPLEELGVEFDFVSSVKLGNYSEHKVYFFHARKPLKREIKSKFRSGNVVEIMPIGRNSIEHMVLGNIVRCSKKNFCLDDDDDNDEDDEVISIMVYNVSGETFQTGVRLVVLSQTLSLVRQFDACTNGKNSLKNELLGNDPSSNNQNSYLLREYNETCLESVPTNDKMKDCHVEILGEKKNEEDEVIGEESQVTVIDTDVKNEVVENKDDYIKGDLDDNISNGFVLKGETNELDNTNELNEINVPDGTNNPDEPREPNEPDQHGFIHYNHNESESDKHFLDVATEELSQLNDIEEKLLQEMYNVPRLNQTQLKAAKGFLSSDKRISIVQG